MLSLTSLVISCRMRLLSIRKHKVGFILSIVFLVPILVWGPTAYKESWLNPFSTLNVPNRELHPRAINKLGMINTDDPFKPLYFTDEAKILELLQSLQRSTSLSSEQALLSLENQKVKYFTLHRDSSKYHEEEDYALQYYSEKGIVRFGQHFFLINEASIYNFTQIEREMTAGWWK